MLIVSSSRHSPRLINAMSYVILSTFHIILDILLEHVHLLSIQGPGILLGLAHVLNPRCLAHVLGPIVVVSLAGPRIFARARIARVYCGPTFNSFIR